MAPERFSGRTTVTIDQATGAEKSELQGYAAPVIDKSVSVEKHDDGTLQFQTAKRFIGREGGKEVETGYQTAVTVTKGTVRFVTQGTKDGVLLLDSHNDWNAINKPEAYPMFHAIYEDVKACQQQRGATLDPETVVKTLGQIEAALGTFPEATVNPNAAVSLGHYSGPKR